MKSKWMPERKILASGLAGLAVWLVSLLAEWYGVPVSSDVLGGVIAIVVPAVGYLVPPSVRDVATRLDSDLREVFELRQSLSPGLTPPVDEVRASVIDRAFL